jgi:hypothetical protein
MRRGTGGHRPGATPPPSVLFDAALGGAGSLEALGLEVVARPGSVMAPDVQARPGDLLVRRALGEGRLAVLSAVERLSGSRATLEAHGVACEGYGDGIFVEVHGATGRRALRIAGPGGLVSRDTVLLRPRRAPRVRPRPIAGEDEPVAAPSPAAPAPVPPRAAEDAFILDNQRSTLELLPAAERDRYLTFAWQHDDFPGNATGPNEARAQQMFAALTRLRPERRANTGDAAAVRGDEFDAAMQRRIAAALADVAGARGQRLHRLAAASFAQMRTAAAADGVTLSINNSYRSAARAAANAARAGNRGAVASFSSHTLGLAVDLNMSHSGLRFSEVSTRPFQNLVDMYRSAVHKWMFLRGEAHGWYPYRREPWHWEYNPPGFRERLRQGDAPAESLAEAAGDPVIPPLAPLSLRGSVGRGGRNQGADVRTVQDRLVALRELAAADALTERPTGTAVVAEAALARTIHAIDACQRRLGLPVTGRVDTTGATRKDLDRTIPIPTAAELTDVTTERGRITQVIGRGLTLTGSVGTGTAGNAPADVRATQRRLVAIGKLAASHGEEPPAGATAPVAVTALRATITALRTFQRDVDFWVGKGVITGAVTPGLAAPGDATAALLDQISVHDLTRGTARLTLRDHVVSGATQSPAGVMFVGTSAPAAIPVADYVAQGLTAGQAAALKLVSTHEGNFDAINTYDRAVVSVGFIQFAGGRGLPPYLALLKARQPVRFREYLQAIGVDVEFTAVRGAIEGSRIVVLDPPASAVLRGPAAETAIRDDKRLTAALILSGRERDVQLVQIEAAVLGYVKPSLASTVAWDGGSARLESVLRSQKGMACLFDRAIQEGLGAARRRFERVIARVARTPPPTPPARTSLADLQAREGDVLAELERDLQAAADVGTRVVRARSGLQTLVRAAGAAGATVAVLLARSELADARRAVTEARTACATLVNVSPASGSTVDATITTMTTTLSAEETRLAFTPLPASISALTSALNESRRALATTEGPIATAPMFLARIQQIRRSTLDSGLTETAEVFNLGHDRELANGYKAAVERDA